MLLSDHRILTDTDGQTETDWAGMGNSSGNNSALLRNELLEGGMNDPFNAVPVRDHYNRPTRRYIMFLSLRKRLCVSLSPFLPSFLLPVPLLPECGA